MQAVNKYLFLFSIFITMTCHTNASEDKNSVEAMRYVRSKIITITSDLGSRVKHCTNEKERSTPPKIDIEIVNSFGVEKYAIIHSIRHLSNRNFAKCEGSYRIELAYQLGILKSLGTYYDVVLPPIDEIKEAIIYPTSQDIDAELAFNSLPQKAQDYFLKVVGEQPFDWLKTVTASKIIDE